VESVPKAAAKRPRWSHGSLNPRVDFLTQLTDRAPLLKRIIARLIGFDGAYHRFTGKVTVERFERGVRVERFDDRAIWELMYFGKARRQGVEIYNFYYTANVVARVPSGTDPVR
jgi:hypothetical protein